MEDKKPEESAGEKPEEKKPKAKKSKKKEKSSSEKRVITRTTAQGFARAIGEGHVKALEALGDDFAKRIAAALVAGKRLGGYEKALSNLKAKIKVSEARIATARAASDDLKACREALDRVAITIESFTKGLPALLHPLEKRAPDVIVEGGEIKKPETGDGKIPVCRGCGAKGEEGVKVEKCKKDEQGPFCPDCLMIHNESEHANDEDPADLPIAGSIEKSGGN